MPLAVFLVCPKMRSTNLLRPVTSETQSRTAAMPAANVQTRIQRECLFCSSIHPSCTDPDTGISPDGAQGHTAPPSWRRSRGETLRNTATPIAGGCAPGTNHWDYPCCISIRGTRRCGRDPFPFGIHRRSRWKYQLVGRKRKDLLGFFFRVRRRRRLTRLTWVCGLQ